MKDFKKSLEFKTTKNVDEVICAEIIKSMKKLCAELERNKNKDNENTIKKQIALVKDRTNKIKWIFMNFDKCIEFIEPKRVIKNIKVVAKNENEIDKKIAMYIENCLYKLYSKTDSEEDKKQVLSRINGLDELLENFDKNFLKIQRMEMQQTKLGYLALAEVR